MKNISVCFLVVTTLLFFTLGALADGNPPPEGGVLPEIILPIPQNQDHREYLGLDGNGSFQIPQIRAQIVIIEIFSMYCPHCQREAPNINQFYNQLESDPGLKGKLKLIGIGVGNSDFEVNFFRKKYAIPFPLFSDANFMIHKKIGEVRTPYFIGVKIAGNGEHTIFYSQLGGPQDSRQLFENLMQSSGLK
jgi:peroxiredoxin